MPALCRACAFIAELELSTSVVLGTKEMLIEVKSETQGGRGNEVMRISTPVYSGVEERSLETSAGSDSRSR